MEIINFSSLEANKSALKEQWNDATKPFHYLIYDDFFVESAAKEILFQYPSVSQGEWDGTTYINQKNKFTMTKFGSEKRLLKNVFDVLNGDRFLNILTEITGIQNLIGDEELFGGGLHQSTNGAFLDVHVDFNIHSKTKSHRRLNAIIYMNENWKEQYNGYLELWNMKTQQRLEKIKPAFNRLVIFETNEISYHGHPKPLNTPAQLSRKSIAVYYYTRERPLEEIVDSHNTLYVNTEGSKGAIKNLKSGFKAAMERMAKFFKTNG